MTESGGILDKDETEKFIKSNIDGKTYKNVISIAREFINILIKTGIELKKAKTMDIITENMILNDNENMTSKAYTILTSRRGNIDNPISRNCEKNYDIKVELDLIK